MSGEQKIPEAAATPSAPSSSLLKRFSEGYGSVRSIVLNTLFLMIVGFVALLMYREVVKRDIIISNIKLHPLLEAQGYTPEIIANLFQESIEKIYSDISPFIADQEERKKGRISRILPESRSVDITIPEFGFSFKTLSQFIKQPFNSRSIRIVGGFVCDSFTCDSVKSIGMRLHIVGSSTVAITKMESIGDQSIENYMHYSAEQLLRSVDPYALAAYYMTKEKEDEALTICEDVISDSLHEDRALCLNLAGDIMLDKDADDQAVALSYLLEAVHIDVELQGAHDNLLNALAKVHNDNVYVCAKIIQDEIEDRGESPQLYSTLGWVYLSIGDDDDLDDSVVAFRKAITLRNDYGDAYHGLAQAQEALEDWEGAEVSYRNAAAYMTSSSDEMAAGVYSSWGMMLLNAGRYEEALTAFVEAARRDSFYLVLILDSAEQAYVEGNVEVSKKWASTYLTFLTKGDEATKAWSIVAGKYDPSVGVDENFYTEDGDIDNSSDAETITAPPVSSVSPNAAPVSALPTPRGGGQVPQSD